MDARDVGVLKPGEEAGLAQQIVSVGRIGDAALHRAIQLAVPKSAIRSNGTEAAKTARCGSFAGGAGTGRLRRIVLGLGGIGHGVRLPGCRRRATAARKLRRWRQGWNQFVRTLRPWNRL